MSEGGEKVGSEGAGRKEGGRGTQGGLHAGKADRQRRDTPRARGPWGDETSKRALEARSGGENVEKIKLASRRMQRSRQQQ